MYTSDRSDWIIDDVSLTLQLQDSVTQKCGDVSDVLQATAFPSPFPASFRVSPTEDITIRPSLGMCHRHDRKILK